MSSMLLCTSFLIFTTKLPQTQAQQETSQDHQFNHRFNLPPIEAHRLFHKINNIKTVYNSQDCWIVVKQDSTGAPPEKFLELAKKYTGPVMFGLIQHFPEELDGTHKGSAEFFKDKAFLFPSGGLKIKQTKKSVYKDEKQLVYNGLLTQIDELDLEDLQFSLTSAYKNSPVKFPLIITIPENSKKFEILATAKVFTSILGKYFDLKIVMESDAADFREKTGVDARFPEVVVLLGKLNKETERMRFDALRMDKTTEFNWYNVLNWLFTVNEDERVNLVGDNKAGDEKVQLMTDVAKVLRERLGLNDVLRDEL